jgi:hypothetical protein
MATNDHDDESHDTLVRSLAARTYQLGRDEARIVDALMMRLEKHRLEGGEIDLSDPSTLPIDTVIALLAHSVVQRDEDRARRLAELESEELGSYMEWRA